MSVPELGCCVWCTEPAVFVGASGDALCGMCALDAIADQQALAQVLRPADLN